MYIADVCKVIMFIDVCVGMCMYMCMDMRIDMCMDSCIDMCADMCQLGLNNEMALKNRGRAVKSVCWNRKFDFIEGTGGWCVGDGLKVGTNEVLVHEE